MPLAFYEKIILPNLRKHSVTNNIVKTLPV